MKSLKTLEILANKWSFKGLGESFHEEDEVQKDKEGCLKKVESALGKPSGGCGRRVGPAAMQTHSTRTAFSRAQMASVRPTQRSHALLLPVCGPHDLQMSETQL